MHSRLHGHGDPYCSRRSTSPPPGFGAALAGPIADLFGLQAVFRTASALTLLALPGFLIVTEARLALAEAHSATVAADRWKTIALGPSTD